MEQEYNFCPTWRTVGEPFLWSLDFSGYNGLIARAKANIYQQLSSPTCCSCLRRSQSLVVKATAVWGNRRHQLLQDLKICFLDEWFNCQPTVQKTGNAIYHHFSNSFPLVPIPPRCTGSENQHLTLFIWILSHQSKNLFMGNSYLLSAEWHIPEFTIPFSFLGSINLVSCKMKKKDDSMSRTEFSVKLFFFFFLIHWKTEDVAP